MCQNEQRGHTKLMHTLVVALLILQTSSGQLLLLDSLLQGLNGQLGGLRPPHTSLHKPVVPCENPCHVIHEFSAKFSSMLHCPTQLHPGRAHAGLELRMNRYILSQRASVAQHNAEQDSDLCAISKHVYAGFVCCQSSFEGGCSRCLQVLMVQGLPGFSVQTAAATSHAPSSDDRHTQLYL